VEAMKKEGKRAIAIIEAKHGWEWHWGHDDKMYHDFKIEKIKGNYKVYKVGEKFKSGAGLEGVGNINYDIYEIKIYKDFVGRIVKTTNFRYLRWKNEETLFDNITEYKNKVLKRYEEILKKAKKLKELEIFGWSVELYFDHVLFNLEEFLKFCKKLEEKGYIDFMSCRKNQNGAKYEYLIKARGIGFEILYSNSYKDHEKIDKILEEHGIKVIVKE
jgi:hypothetical protein